MTLNLEQLEPRFCLSSFLPGMGISSPQVENIYVGSVPNEDALTQVLVNDYAPLLSAYGESQGSYKGSLTLPDPGGSNLTDAWLQTQINQLIHQGTIMDSTNTLIMIYLPRKVSDAWAQQGYAAYNSWVPEVGPSIYYGVMWPGYTMSILASHEFAEASSHQQIADPYENSSFYLGGYQMSEFAEPNGAMYIPGPGTQSYQIQQEEYALLFLSYYAYQTGNAQLGLTLLEMDLYLSTTTGVPLP